VAATMSFQNVLLVAGKDNENVRIAGLDGQRSD